MLHLMEDYQYLLRSTNEDVDIHCFLLLMTLINVMSLCVVVGGVISVGSGMRGFLSTTSVHDYLLLWRDAGWSGTWFPLGQVWTTPCPTSNTLRPHSVRHWHLLLPVL